MYKKELLNKLIAQRKNKSLTTISLARLMGISARRIANIESGQAEPTLEELETIKAFIEGRL